MKDTYTLNEVINMLVYNMNETMNLIDKSKYYSVNFDKQIVYCYKKSWVLFGRGNREDDVILSEYSFEYVISEAKGLI